MIVPSKCQAVANGHRDYDAFCQCGHCGRLLQSHLVDQGLDQNSRTSRLRIMFEAQSPATEAAALRRLVGSAEIATSVLALRNERTSPEDIGTWATSDDHRRAAAAMSNPSCPPDALAEVLHARRGPWVTALANPSLPVSEFERLAREGDDTVVTALTQNRSCPTHVLTLTLTNGAWKTRMNVAAHPNAAVEDVNGLLSDPTPEVQYIARTALREYARTRFPITGSDEAADLLMGMPRWWELEPDGVEVALVLSLHPAA